MHMGDGHQTPKERRMVSDEDPHEIVAARRRATLSPRQTISTGSSTSAEWSGWFHRFRMDIRNNGDDVFWLKCF
ncbi:hypothetical protein TNIN_117541 [Trichonephila inaurata madagascariensis]|uniref:Uncharacterized protein n=1 Tax=Trichonephila inaurata madagascariensis TaxID=2747483 RepID=A0A8X6KEX8_9ARAC|nr:hypothetical protein TNIN_117541 [Trichonephila inaurata madagascariensis]